MTVLTLTSTKHRPLRPLVEAALENQLRLLHAGITRTEEHLRSFEETYGLSSPEFICCSNCLRNCVPSSV